MLIVVLSNLRSIEAAPSGFSNPINISNGLGESILPQIAVSGNDVYVLWNDNATGKFGIFLTKSTDGGTNFGTPVNISKNIGSSGSPQFAVSGNNVYVVWQAQATGKYQILFAKSTDGGATFTTPVNISNTTDNSNFKQMVLSDNNIYVVWQDGSKNQHEILFAKSTTFVPEFGALASLVLLVAILSAIILFAKTIPRLKMNSVF